MRSTIVISLLLVLLIIAIIGGVVVYSPEQSTIVVTDTENPPADSFEVVSKPTPTAKAITANLDDATESQPSNLETFDPIQRAHDAVNSLTPIIQSASQRSWAGHVFNAVDQKPMAGVAVNLNGQVTDETSEGDGRFTAKLPSDIQSVSATLSYPGYNSVGGILNRDHNQNIFIMIPEGALFVEVIDNANRPVLFAQIEIKSNSGFWSKSVTADIRGRYFEPNPPDAGLTISASYQGYTDEGQATKIVEPPFLEKISLQLNRPYFSISGRVVDRDTQKGVEWVSLTATSKSVIRQEFVSTDKNGYYEFPDLLPSSYTIELAPKDDSFHVVPEQRSRVVRVIDKHARDVNFELVRGYSVSGIVVDANGSPVPDATVYLTPYPTILHKNFMLEEDVTTTDAQGNFTLYNLPPTSNKESRIAAVHKELGSGVSEPFDPNEGELGPFTITLNGLSTVEGIVVDESGAAIAGAMVDVHSPDLALMATVPGSQTTTGSDGEFSITLPAIPSSSDKAPLSTYQYRISAMLEPPDRDITKFQFVQKTIELKPGESKNVTLVLPTQKGIIRGRVTNQSGTPISGSIVYARNQRYGVFTANTDENGVYSFGKSEDTPNSTHFLHAGVYDLEFIGPGNPTQRGALYQVKTGTLNADVVLTSKTWRVTGGVIDADTREPIHQLGIYVESVPMAERARPYLTSIQINSYDGTYEVPFYEYGRYRLRFYADGYDPQAGIITVVETSKEIQVQNVELKRTETTGSIYGQFVAPSGTQLGKVEVVGIGVFPASNNQFNIENLPPGGHDLVFYLFEVASQSYTPIGVLTSVTVMAGGKTQIGPVTAANLQTRYVNQ
ncbi:MAG: carboxypeptidase-like regulatory domain-containing protein [Candidatus Hinthialibacter antarcticus]|nr:carboxypeptidase-like regulatory domain-containing protein [Candidatus Hinthialibacter antarcticus]